jgi:Glycosyltransferase 61
MHLFEFALRDFINLERACGRDSVIAVHDCDPPNAEAAARERTTAFWTGDVWKLVLCLKRHRPDLRVAVVDVPPSGLGIVTNLDPGSTLLEERYAQICDELVELDFCELAEAKHEKLSIVPPALDLVRSMLPTPERRPAPRCAASRHILRLADDPTEIALCGYPKPVLRRVVEAATRLEVRSDAPPLRRFRNLTFFPKYAALYDEGGRRVIETCVRAGPGLDSVRHRPPELLEIPRGLPRIDQPVLYLGRLRAHWGHFLTETTSRLWALSDAGVPADARLLFQHFRKRGVEFTKRFFDHAGIDPGRVLDPNSATTLSEVFVPHPSFSLGGEAFRRHVALPERIAETICRDACPEDERPLYLSRRLASNRRIAGEQELEDVLIGRGVMVVSPETLGYEDQVRLFNRHSVFVGRIGSAFHSLLYALPGRTRRTVVFGDTVSYYERGYYPDYFMIDALKGIRATYVFDSAEADGGAPTVDVDATVACLERLSAI